jgi:hypothetical protein
MIKIISFASGQEGHYGFLRISTAAVEQVDIVGRLRCQAVDPVSLPDGGRRYC